MWMVDKKTGGSSVIKLHVHVHVLTILWRDLVRLDRTTGSLSSVQPNTISGIVTAHTTWAHWPEGLSVGLRAPPLKTHKQHS